MDEIQLLKEEIKEIKKRNARVEADKKWETSFFRKILIAVLTYLVIVLFLVVTDFSRPFLNAIVPALGFIFSTLSIPFFKDLWLKKRKKA